MKFPRVFLRFVLSYGTALSLRIDTEAQDSTLWAWLSSHRNIQPCSQPLPSTYSEKKLYAIHTTSSTSHFSRFINTLSPRKLPTNKTVLLLKIVLKTWTGLLESRLRLLYSERVSPAKTAPNQFYFKKKDSSDEWILFYLSVYECSAHLRCIKSAILTKLIFINWHPIISNKIWKLLKKNLLVNQRGVTKTKPPYSQWGFVQGPQSCLEQRTVL